MQLTVEKVCNDIDKIVEDDRLFSHLIDETLAFEQEIRDSLGYPSSYCSALTVITQPQYLTKWLAIEEECAFKCYEKKKFYTNKYLISNIILVTTEKMDSILLEPSAWTLIDPDNLEELKIPRCADQFIRLLDAMRERYCNLPQPGHQLQFLNLQLELIETFRRRLVYFLNNADKSVSSTMVINAVNYVNSVLREWGENVVSTMF